MSSESRKVVSAWVVWLVGGLMCVLVFGAFLLYYGNPADAMQDAGRLVQVVGLSILAGTVAGSLLQRVFGGKKSGTKNEKGG